VSECSGTVVPPSVMQTLRVLQSGEAVSPGPSKVLIILLFVHRTQVASNDKK
jgi:hypothetical protein